MARELEALRTAVQLCKDTSPTYDELETCRTAASDKARQAIYDNPNTKPILSCLEELKSSTGFVEDLAKLGANGSFDLEDIEQAGSMMCRGGNQRHTTIDRIKLKDGTEYLIKHEGSVSDPSGDIATWSEAQQIAEILGEDLPWIVWANPLAGRFAMLKIPIQKGTGHYSEYQPPEVLTSLIFEVLMADPDRMGNPGNVVSLGLASIAHLDISEYFAGLQRSNPARGLSPASRSFLCDWILNGPDAVEERAPGMLKAIDQALSRWTNQWRPAIAGLGFDIAPQSAWQDAEALLTTLANGRQNLPGMDSDDLGCAYLGYDVGGDEDEDEEARRAAEEANLIDGDVENCMEVKKYLENARGILDKVRELPASAPRIDACLLLRDAKEVLDSVERDKASIDSHGLVDCFAEVLLPESAIPAAFQDYRELLRGKGCEPPPKEQLRLSVLEHDRQCQRTAKDLVTAKRYFDDVISGARPCDERTKGDAEARGLIRDWYNGECPVALRRGRAEGDQEVTQEHLLVQALGESFIIAEEGCWPSPIGPIEKRNERCNDIMGDLAHIGNEFTNILEHPRGCDDFFELREKLLDIDRIRARSGCEDATRRARPGQIAQATRMVLDEEQVFNDTMALMTRARDACRALGKA